MTMPVLSKELGISYHHLVKLVQKLRDMNMVRTIQGKQGGVVFSHDPALVTLRMVIEGFDGPTMLSECLEDKKAGFCSLSGYCRLKETFADVQADINKRLDAVNLASLLV
jgi:Rrf2 family nitric oxide-sensitive transcriptional repressor